MEDLFNSPRHIINKINTAEHEYANVLSLSSNENVMSLTARRYLSSNFSNRYFFHSTNDTLFSDFPEFVATSSKSIEEILFQTESTLMKMFDAEYINLSPISGIHAMLMVILSLTNPGDNIASLDPSQNGHYITNGLVERIGRKTIFLPTKKGKIDILNIKKFVKINSIKMIYVDAMSYTQQFDISSIRKAVGDKVIIVFDASHVLGLIAGKQFQKPFAEGADIICGNTHKTFPGPHRGIIITKSTEYGDLINAHEGKFYSSNHLNSLMALAVTTFEMVSYGEAYARKIISNANSLSNLLKKNKVGDDVADTNNHQVHIPYTSRDRAYAMFKKLYSQGINMHLCFSKSEGYFIRLGTQEITRHGMGENEMRIIANVISKIENGEDMRKYVLKLAHKFKKVYYSFDNKTK